MPNIPRLREHFPELSWDGDVKRLLAFSKIRKGKAKSFLIKRGIMHAQWAFRKFSSISNLTGKEAKTQNKPESSAKVVPWKRAKLSSDEIAGNYFISNFYVTF